MRVSYIINFVIMSWSMHVNCWLLDTSRYFILNLIYCAFRRCFLLRAVNHSDVILTVYIPQIDTLHLATLAQFIEFHEFKFSGIIRPSIS